MPQPVIPEWLAEAVAAGHGREPDEQAVLRALSSDAPGLQEFRALVSPAALPHLEAMAAKARALTRRHFGDTISLYQPLYLSNYCEGGCVYCGYAADRRVPRRRLEASEQEREMAALKSMGCEDVLLLTGERTPQADVDYISACVARAAERFSSVSVETFAMTADEYRLLVLRGCTGMTLYQETYDTGVYDEVHRWGEKKDFLFRLAAPARAAAAGMRQVGMGVLLGLADARRDALALCAHVMYLRREFWQAGFSVSFPRICAEQGGFVAPHPVTDRELVQLVCAFRIVLPDAPLVLSTRERAGFRDGMAGVGISRMSVASRTTVGGYGEARTGGGQFDVTDTRDVTEFCEALRRKGLQPVFKNWDALYRAHPAGSAA